MRASYPSNETQRISKLLSYKILDTVAETAYDDLSCIAAQICQTPIALVSLVDSDRQWFKSKVGVSVCETSRDIAFCAHAILNPGDVLVVPDALEDERFATNPLVTGEPYIRFYAGVPLVTPDGYSIGTLCVIDYQPRTLSSQQVEALRALGRQVVSQLEMRLNLEALSEQITERARAEKQVCQLNAELEQRVEQRTTELQQTLDHLKQTQTQLIHTEKISSLGQLVAGVAHEINNPVGFIASNLNYACQYTRDLLDLIKLYQQEYPTPGLAIQEKIDAIALAYVIEDFPKLLSSMKLGTERLRGITDLLRTFSRVDETKGKFADLHQGLDSTIMILKHRLKSNCDRPEINVIQDYGDLPLVHCFPGQLNQVFMNLLANAIDALEEKHNAISLSQIKDRCSTLNSTSKSQKALTIRIHTERIGTEWVRIAIADNGPGISRADQQRLFSSFFTTKPIGKGTGLGLSISHHIVTEKHHGVLKCMSELDQGTEFVIEIPVESLKPTVSYNEQVIKLISALETGDRLLSEDELANHPHGSSI